MDEGPYLDGVLEDADLGYEARVLCQLALCRAQQHHMPVYDTRGNLVKRRRKDRHMYSYVAEGGRSLVIVGMIRDETYPRETRSEILSTRSS